MSCDVVIFDLDGVLLEERDDHWRSILQNDLGLPFDENVEAALRRKTGEYVPDILRACYPKEDPWNLIRKFQEIDTKRVCQLMDGARQVVEGFYRKGKKLWVFTQRDRITTEHHLKTHSIQGFFSELYTMECYNGLGKKNPLSLYGLLFQIKLEVGALPDQCCFVGNNPKIDGEVVLKAAKPPVFFGLAKTEEIRNEFLEMGVPSERIVSSLQEFAVLVA